MALKDFSEGRSDVYKIDPRKLQIKEGWNCRDMSDPANIEHVKQLSLSIAEIGVKEPIKVFVENDIPYITNGECRWRAAMLAIENGAEVKTVPVIGEDRFANESDRLFTQYASNSGKPFSVIEQGKLFKRLIGLGWKQTEIAAKTGISGGRVSQILELQTLPISLQILIIEGKVSATMVLNTFNKYKGDLDKAYAELIAAIAVANEQGRERAMPKDTPGGEGDGEGGKGSGKAKRKSGEKGASLKKHIKAMVEKAYADQQIDDTENTVTWSVSEGDWAELMEMIDY